MAGQSVRGRVVPPGQIKPRPVPNHRAAIEKIGARLTPFGVPADCFQEAATLALGYTDDMVFKLLRPFEAVQEDATIEALLLIGRDEHFYPNVDKADLPAFLRFLDFLRFPAGQKCIGQAHRQARLQRKRKGIHTELQIRDAKAAMEAVPLTKNGDLHAAAADGAACGGAE